MITLKPHQVKAIDRLKNGAILKGGTGSGKSLTSLHYYIHKECGGDWVDDKLVLKNPKDLIIITPAKKRDTFEWDKEMMHYNLSQKIEECPLQVNVIVDSWNNIKKYENMENIFFIFDEQRLVGSGSWVKAFIKITRNNNWILLSATPGDVWTDYIPVFIANGFYKNRTEFLRRHAVYSRFSRYPKIEKFIEVDRLIKLRREITVSMDFLKLTTPIHKVILTDFDKDKFNRVFKDRWNIFEDEPIRDASQLYYAMRKVVNTSEGRKKTTIDILKKYNKIIIFYNFNYELFILRDICDDLGLYYREWNGHKHQQLPECEDGWVYIVQYTAGSEAWNCITTNHILFYSMNYSYKIMIQSAGRIDRMNTPFSDLYYYHLRSNSFIDNAITKSLKNKKNFQEKEIPLA